MRSTIFPVLLALVAGCGAEPVAEDDDNPFLQDQSNSGKEDTAYVNPDGTEVEVDLEADVEGPAYKLADGPAHVGQFALTYLRKRGDFYLESLAEDASSDGRVEWLVDGTWITAAQAGSVSTDKLRHFRLRGVNAVLLHSAADGVTEGKVFTARVPLRPFSVMTDAGATCADEDGHMELSQSVYWYMWNPDRSGCTAQVQDMTVTVSRLLPAGRVTYPEFDQLVADGKVTAVVLFGLIGDEMSESDIGFTGMKRMARWLADAGYQEVTPAPIGRRFSKHIGSVDFEIDLYSPKDFSGLSDYAHFGNFQTAISEHEIVAYDGHSMLGASDYWERPTYPGFYQIFLYGGCLGYEYYVRPILDSKGGWEKVDIMSSVIEVSAGANEFAGPVLAKIAWALDHGYAASWPDILVAVRKRVGDSTFGVSGVRDNCFSPGGSLCGTNPDPGTARRYESTGPVAIPDDDQAGASSVIDVPDAFVAGAVTLELDVTHTWVGDLQIIVQHGGLEWLVWNGDGGSADNIHQSFVLDAFAGKPVEGPWTLRVIDGAAQDVGTLNGWALVIQP